MAAIDVDFEVFKALTLRRASENVTYNEVVRDLLGMPSSTSATPPRPAAGRTFSGVVFKGVEFPDGTQFRATHKGKTHTGEIRGGVWIDSRGRRQSSPSRAAFDITKSSVNGWRFWECSRPSDPSWILIDNLR